MLTHPDGQDVSPPLALRLARRLAHVEAILAALALTALLGLSLGQILLRNLADSAIPQAELLSRHLVLALLFLGAALALHADRHIRIDLAVQWLGKHAHRLVPGFHLAALVVNALFAQAGWRFFVAERAAAGGTQLLESALAALMPAGFALLALHSALALLAHAGRRTTP